MPQIQIIDNPQANSMRDAASGLSALTQANEALRARRAMRWQMLKDLPPAARRAARKAFAEDEMNVDTDVMPSAPSAPQPSEQAAPSGGGLKAIEQSTPKETSLLGKLGALFAPTPEPAENPTYDENRVSKQTLARLSGDNPALGRSISDAEAQDIIKFGGKEMNYGGVMATYENGSTDPKYTFGGREATDEMVNTMADRLGARESETAANADAAYRAALKKNIERFSDFNSLNETDMQNLMQFGNNLSPRERAALKLAQGDALDSLAGNRAKTVAAYAARITPRGAPSASAAQREPGPEIYDDSVPTQVAQQGQPAQGSAPAPRLVAGGSQSTAASRGSSFKGAQGSQFGPQGAVSDEDVANIDFLANDWAGAQTGYSKAMLYAKRIKDPAASAAAMQYVNSMFENRMGSYDDGVSKEMVQMSEREASKQSTSNKGGWLRSTEYGTDGYMIINGQWQPVFQAAVGSPDIKAVAALMSVKYGASNHLDLLNAAKRTVDMAAQGSPEAIEVLKKARVTTGLANGRLYPSDVTNKHVVNDPTKGIMIGDNSFLGMDDIYNAVPIANGAEGETHWFRPDERAIPAGGYATPKEAGLIEARRGGGGEKQSARKKVSGIQGN